MGLLGVVGLGGWRGVGRGDPVQHLLRPGGVEAGRGVLEEQALDHRPQRAGVG